MGAVSSRPAEGHQAATSDAGFLQENLIFTNPVCLCHAPPIEPSSLSTKKRKNSQKIRLKNPLQ